MSSKSIELIETKLLKPFKYPRLVHNGYLYHFHKKCNQHLRWKCNRVYSLKCPAVLRTNSDLLSIEFIAVDHDHVHGDDNIAIYDLKMKIKTHQKSSMFQNNTMFKPKNGYAAINFNEEDIPENIDNKLARFCASMNQIFFVNPLDPDYEDTYIDKHEQAIEIKISNDKSSNFENCPNNRFLLRNRKKQKQIEINNAKNDITENNINCPSFNDKINISIQTCGEIWPNELSMIASKKNDNDRQINESSLSTNTQEEENNVTTNTCQGKNSLISNINKDKNVLTTNTNKIQNNLTINTRGAKNFVISNMNIENNTLTTNMPEEINTLTINTNNKINNLTNNTRRAKNSVISNMNIENNILTNNMPKEKNTLTTNTNKNIKNLINNTCQVKNSLISNMNIENKTLTNNMHEDNNALTTNTNKKINNLTINTRRAKNSVISNMNIENNTLTNNMHEDNNTLTTNTNKKINNFTINTRRTRNSVISNMNIENNTLTNNMHEDNNTLTTNTNKKINNFTINTRRTRNSVISNMNIENNTLTNNMHEDNNALTTNTNKKINNFTINTRRTRNSVISNMNIENNTLTNNMHEDNNTLTTNTNKKINNLTINTRRTKNSMVSNMNIENNTLTTNMPEEKNTLTIDTNNKINNLTNNIHQENNFVSNNMIIDKNTLTNNMQKEKNTLTTNTNKKINNLIINTCQEKNSVINNMNIDKNTLTSNTHKEINNFTIKTYKKKNSLINYLNKPKNTLTISMHKNKNTLTSNIHKKINMLTTNTYKNKNSLISNKNRRKNVFTSNIYKKKNILARNNYKVKNILTTNTHKHKRTLSKNTLKKINIRTTNKQKKKNRIITNTHRKIISLKLKNYNFKHTNQKKHKIKNTSIIVTPTIKSTTTFLSPTVENTPAIISTSLIKSTPTILTPEIISTSTILTPTISIPTVKSVPTTLTSAIINTPTILTPTFSIPIVKSIPTTLTSAIINRPTILTPTISIPTVKDIPTILTSTIINTPTTLTSAIINRPTILTPTISIPTVKNIPTVKSAPKIIKSIPIFKITPSIKNYINKNIDYENDVISNNNDNNSDNDDDTDRHDEEYNNITKDVNLVHDNLIPIYCKENWPTILNKMNDPLTGIKIYESILLTKICTQMIHKHFRTKLNIQKIKGRILHWKLKYDCLAFKMKRLKEHTRTDKNTRDISIQNKNKKDTTLWKNIEIVKKENNKGIKEKVFTDLKNNITPNNFKISKLYKQSLNIQNRNLTGSDTDIKTAKSKERKTNISLSPMMVDLIKKIPSSTIVSISSPELIKSKKRKLTESDTCITRTKSKIKKTKNSSIPNFDNLDVHIPSETTVSIISPKSCDTKQHNLTESDSGISMTQSENMESDEPYTPVLNIPKALRVSQRLLNNRKCKLIQSDTSVKITKPKVKKLKKSSTSINLTVDNPPDLVASRFNPKSLNSLKTNFTQYNTAIEMTESKVLEYNNHSTLVSTSVCANTPTHMTLLRSKSKLFNSKKTISTQCDIDIGITKSNIIKHYENFTPAAIDITPDMTASILSSNFLKNQQSILAQYNTEIKITESNIIEYYKPSTSSINLTVNNPPVIKASGLSYNILSNQRTISTQYNTAIKKTKSKKIESTPLYIDLTVDSPPDMTTSRISPSILNSQQSILTQNDTKIKISESNIIEYYDPSISASIDLNLNNLPVMTNANLSSKKNIFTQYNKDIKISSTSISTNLNSNIPAFSNSSPSVITPSNGNLLLNKVITPTLFPRFPPNLDILMVDKNAQLSSLNLSKNPNYENWRSPKSLIVYPKRDKSSRENAILPVAIMRATNPNVYSPLQYPMLNKLLTQSTSTTIKKNIINTPINIQMKAPLPNVVYKSTQIMNKINYMETIQSNHSHNNLIKAPNLIKPVPIAIPLLPSEIIYDYSDEMGVKRPFYHGTLTKYNENILLPRPILSIKTNNNSIKPSISLSWVLNTKFQAETIRAYEIFCCEPISGVLNDGFNPWKLIGKINALPMACTVTEIGLRGKICYYSIRAKNVQNENGPFSHPRPFILN